MDAPVFDYMREHRFKKVVLCNDTASGLRAVIAIHSTALGPATGGLRMWTYPNEQAAIFDALRLARGMTYKYAAAGVNLGGGKAVIIGDPRTEKTEALLRAMGRMIDQLGGEYITGEDVGTTLEDMETIYTETNHVVTLPEHWKVIGETPTPIGHYGRRRRRRGSKILAIGGRPAIPLSLAMVPASRR